MRGRLCGWTGPKRVGRSIELAILQGDCLNLHIATKELSIAEIKAWWQLTTKDARIKLHKLDLTT
ncbi:hypothetical protein GCM10027190_10590 [Spirosoma areae]